MQREDIINFERVRRQWGVKNTCSNDSSEQIIGLNQEI